MAPSRRTRAEIQALRAIAVAAVVVYHLRPTALPGGYVGVDVFFVISGFLISGHLLREAEWTGRVDLAAFWAGRVRRILPAALVTTAAIVAAATLLLPRTAAAGVGRTALWAAASAANWLFAAQAVDYQAQTPDASPFEHFWSLGVEEQFYLVWPLLVLLVAVLARRRVRSVQRWAVLPFALVLIASLGFGIWFTASGSAAAYFVTPTRMWELAAGGLLAALLGDREPSPVPAAVLQAGGSLAIAAGAVLLTAATPMPGIAALLPVAGAVAFIAGGDVPVLRRVWALRPVRFVGDVSYSLYLLHWPVIVFTRTVTHQPIGWRTGLAVVAGSLLLAAASYRFVEQPLRRVPLRRPVRVVAVGGLAVAVVVVVAAVPLVRDAAISAQEGAARAAVLAQDAGAPLGYPQLGAAGGSTWARSPHVVVPDVSALPADLTLPGCATGAGSPTSKVCVIGDASSTTTVAMAGDSHLRQWGSVIDVLARKHHWRVVTVLHNSCPFSLTPRSLEASGYSRCTDAVRWTLPVLQREHVRVVLTSAYRKSYPASEEGAAADGYSAMWRTLQRDGVQVVALGDTPTPRTDPIDVDCIASGDLDACGLPRRSAVGVADPLRAAAAETPGVPFIDPTDAFCTADRCPGVIGNVGVYVDDNHSSNTYLRTTLPFLEQRLAPAIEQALH